MPHIVPPKADCRAYQDLLASPKPVCLDSTRIWQSRFFWGDFLGSQTCRTAYGPVAWCSVPWAISKPQNGSVPRNSLPFVISNNV